MKDYYQLTETIEYYIEEFTQRGLFDLLPDLKSELGSYEQKISDSSDQIIYGNYLQRFEIPFSTRINKDFYTLNWGINSKISEGQEIVKIKISNTDRIIHSDGKLLDLEKVNFFVNRRIDSPIIIANHLPIGKYVVIDGNHRLAASSKRGDDLINAIILEPSQHINYLLTDKMKSIYKINHNLFVLHNLCAKPQCNFCYKSNHTLRYKTFYHFDKSINFTNWDNLKLIYKNFLNKKI